MRYVDADKLIAHLKDEMKECHLPFESRSGGKGIAYGTILGLKSAISFVETLATVDVVSKEDLKDILMKKKACVPPSLPSDVVREIEVRARTATNTIKAEVAREIFEEIEELAKYYTFPVVKNGVVEIEKEPFWCFEPNDLAQLKKKYTEEQS